MTKIVNVGLSSIDIFNAEAGVGFKQAAKEGLCGEVKGYGVFEKEKEDGKKELVSIVKFEDSIVSGTSVVLANRLKAFESLFGEDKVNVKFKEIACGKGTGVTIEAY